MPRFDESVLKKSSDLVLNSHGISEDWESYWKRMTKLSMRWVRKKETIRKSNEGKVREVCDQCGYCCISRPCALEPQDLGKIASYLGLSEEETFRNFLIVDRWRDYEENACDPLMYYVSPKKQGDVEHVVTCDSWQYFIIPCTFLTEDYKCCIYPVIPREGRDCKPHSNGRCYSTYSAKEAVQDWQGDFPEFVLTILRTEYGIKVGGMSI